ncbi:SDR family oxidoreductase [Curvibacter sp. HBC61]|uniref:SDR family oxidoreductase n=1 Tax=Curvibacter cyanobacteriorum TaxID=3026422 RepID=A0ABT5N063_9BURK|nr:SDR family oxidoreductase [Curvibacter sp. HBC61]MDD0839036.1 SDR family oxidoreductase [Curvibacter sp. HBC61]
MSPTHPSQPTHRAAGAAWPAALGPLPAIQDQVALVTGANAGMGLATTRALLEAGYRVAATDLRVDQVAQSLAAHRDRLFCTPMDVSDVQAVDAACRRIEAHWGRIDVCVNNAGILQYANCEQTTPELWQRILRVNLDGVFYVSQRVAPGMKARRFGRIVNIASFGAKTGGLSPLPAYAASKGGVVTLTFSFAREYAAFGVTCNALAPAFVKTQMVTEQVSPERQAELRRTIPVGRFCELEEFAHCVLFLAHPMSGFITGEVLDLNGGLQFD